MTVTPATRPRRRARTAGAARFAFPEECDARVQKNEKRAPGSARRRVILPPEPRDDCHRSCKSNAAGKKKEKKYNKKREE